jgi:hypothetical protein
MKVHPFPCQKQDRAEMRFNPDTGIVDFFLRDNWIYDVDLNRFRDPVEALDWIRQLSQKNWFTLQMITKLCLLACGVLNG